MSEFDYEPSIEEGKEEEIQEVVLSPLVELDEWDMDAETPYHNPFTAIDEKTVGAIPIPSIDVTSENIEAIINGIVEDAGLEVTEKKQLIERINNVFTGSFLSRYSGVDTGQPLAQYLSIDGKRLPHANVNANVAKGTTKLTGRAARQRIQSRTGTGATVVWRLPHSGMTVEIGNFSPGELFAFQTRLTNSIEEVGANTRGQIISADDAHVVIKQVDWVLDHLTNCTLKNWTIDKVAANLDVRDLYILLTGGLGAIYPQGYPFVRDCDFKRREDGSCDWSTLKEKKPRDVARLDFRMITHFDRSRFTQKQTRLLGRPWGNVTEEELKDYREGFDIVSKLTPPLNDDCESIFRAVIRAPMYDHYRRENLQWLSDVVLEVDRALEAAPDLSLKESRERRIRAIENFVTRVTAQRHASWIDHIVESTEGHEDIIYGGNETEDDREDVIEVLGDLSMTETICQNLIDAVEQFKVDYQYAFVGIPNYKCPSCNRDQYVKLEKRPNIIPIPVPHYFFAITVLNRGRKS